jgi:4-amino-4-deoxy-L-arabinose transferase-like glycosyltransferase
MKRQAIVLILILAVAYRLWVMTGDITYDPAVYAQDAFNLLHGTFDLRTDSWYSHRLPVFVPVAPIYAVLGVSDLSTNLWPLVMAALQILAVFWVGSRLLSKETALLAAVLLAIHPLDVIYGGILSPDVVQAALLTFSCAFWILGIEGRAQPSRLFLFLSGFFCALAADTRAFAFLIVLFFAGHAVWRRIPLRGLAWWGLGIAAVGVPLALIYALVAGDVLLPARAISGFYGNPANAEAADLLYYPRLILRLRSNNGLFSLFFTAAAAWAFARRTRERLLFLAWIAPILLYLQFGSMSLRAYVPVFKWERFLTPFLAPAALLSASVVMEAAALLAGGAARALRAPDAKPWRRGLIACVVLVLLANSLWIVRANRAEHVPVGAGLKAAARVLESDTSAPILFDHWRTAIQFGYYLRFEEGSHLYEGADETRRMLRGPTTAGTRLGYLKWYEDPGLVPEALVVLDDRILAEADRAAAADPTRSNFPAKDIPIYAHDPPPSWRLLGRFGTVRVFRTAGEAE